MSIESEGYDPRPGINGRIERLEAENAKLRAVVDELRTMETIERLRADLKAAKKWALDSDETNDRLRIALHRNACRYRPELSHDAALRDILLKGVNVTNSENQATRWAREIIERMYAAGYMIESIDAGRS